MSIESIKGFGLSERYVQRQTFAKIVGGMFEFKKISDKYQDELMELVNLLSEDKVFLVRITLAVSIISNLKE